MSNTTRLAVDIGGTFTDLALETGTGFYTTKVLTTPSAPQDGVTAGVAQILETAGIAAGDVDILIHGTTLATNAVIERKGARTALLTTEGHRDVLALRNESRYDQYDLNIVLPEPLVPRHLRLPIPERVDNEGKVRLPLDERAVTDTIPLLRKEKVESIAVGYMHGFVNPDHEKRTRDILAAALPDVPISLASEVSPEMREWERFSTAVANAYVQPLIQRYLTLLEAQLREMGLTAPIFMMLSGGGLTTVETARRFPIRIVESGPAGGAIFAAEVARHCELPNVVSFDMGGTTAKICLIDDFRPQTARACEVARVGRFRKGSGIPLRIPVIEMVEIGAGGGSLAKVDALGLITIGPESAGADPGPSCYGRGGTHPTVTDANLALGRYDPAAFAGGTLPLDPSAGEAALLADVGTPLGFDVGMAALGVVEMVDENMANAARVHTIESGKSFDGRTLIAFGGGGPVHATRIGEKLGIGHVIIPSGAGVGSAIGFLRAPVAYTVVRSLYQRLGSVELTAINRMFAEMTGEADDIVARGSFGAATRATRTAFMRYVGQGHEIAVELPVRDLDAADITAIRADYECEYSRLYNRVVPGADIEVLSYEVTVTTAPSAASATRNGAANGVSGPVASRPVRDPTTGAVSDWAIVPRAGLSAGTSVAGPAIITEDETSTLVGSGWTAAIDGNGYIHISWSAAS
ncbi:hydantoinase/oxoprolinase family protein [Acuticoccus kandeliae]|uniref:hydantoinase/oxoprolinase family protein n=1 Tax=Acuticoccus kandeliae TaxID=2073160 RepID=UPI000D3E7734|nr:hydantoinase/oxoprolinase family protein [Acuticoccus kandeliae]